MRLTQRLILGSLLVVTVLFVLAIVMIDGRVATRAQDEIIRQLRREARLLASATQLTDNYDSLAIATARASGRRVSILDSAGNIVGDSEFPAARGTRESQRNRPDVAAALDSSVTSTATYEYSGQRLLHISAPSPAPRPRGAVRLSVPANESAALTAGIRTDVLLAGLTAMFVALAFAALYAQSISRPIVELRDVARALAAGDLSQRPTISAPGEVGELAGAIQRMSEQLSARLGALQNEEVLLSALVDSLHEGIIAVDTKRRVVRINGAGRILLDVSASTPFSTDLLPRHRVLREALSDALAGRTTRGPEIELDARRVALTARPLAGGGAVLALFDVTQIRRLEAVRRDFVANVSHELRTPLTIIGGFAETLSDPDVPEDRRQEFAASIRANAVRMQRLVDDLLDLSRIESGGWTPKPITVDCSEIIGDTIAQNEPEAAAKGLRLASEILPGAESAFADPTAFRQILVNLLTNAIRHTASGTIIVQASPERGGTRVSVTDTGSGIPQEHLPRIFERFYRVDPGRSREMGGTGLGLAIVRHLIEAHGGTAGAESAAGRGTTVWVHFPAADRAVLPAE